MFDISHCIGKPDVIPYLLCFFKIRTSFISSPSATVAIHRDANAVENINKIALNILVSDVAIQKLIPGGSHRIGHVVCMPIVHSIRGH